MGQDVQFRGLQPPVIESIVRGNPLVLVVMDPGVGKSLTFMLPASISDGVTIVVVPLVSLRQDLVRRCRSMGLSYDEWDEEGMNKLSYDARLVLVTPESVVGSRFRACLSLLQPPRRLDRFVIDECHLLLDSTIRWWPAFLKLRELASYEFQTVRLTVTLPLDEEAEWRDRAGV